MLKILGRNSSSNVQKVLWCCDELVLGFEREDVGGPFGRNREADYLRLNPNGLVPTIIDEGFTLWESNTILRYLAGRHGRADLLPAEPQARAVVERWMDWELSVAANPMSTVYRQLIRTPEPQRDATLIEQGSQRWSDAMRVLDTALAGASFLAGDRLTLADVALGPNVYRYLSLPMHRPELPALTRWYARLTGRAGYRRHVMVTMI